MNNSYADQSDIIGPDDGDIDIANQNEFANNSSVLLQEEEFTLLKNSYISPYNYLQDPIALNFGLSSQSSPDGTYHGGTSFIANLNSPSSGGANKAYNTDIAQIWGQTGRWGGFALGGGATGLFNVSQIGQPNTFATTGVIAPVQAYVNYQYSNKVDVTAGNVLISTPWVNSFSSNPGATYAVGNNSYQGILVNAQIIPTLLMTGFTAWGFLQYPNNWYNQTTYYNNSTLLNGISDTNTYGPTGLGLNWNPTNNYSGRLWLYNFSDYANMAYIDNSYHIDLANPYSLDFGLQAFTQGSSGGSITSQSTLPGQNVSAGSVGSNGVGLKMAFTIDKNITSISYNNIFGSGSFLNGGMVTPYTYGLEIDPLYTTPALTSIAELGSGSAYTIRNTTEILDKSLKLNFSFSQFFVNQVYETQASWVNEYDASLLYRIPHTTMNIWTRLVYVDQPENAGGSLWQPRVIYNWTF